jgi:Leucine-rich repeat (LRR) protein
MNLQHPARKGQRRPRELTSRNGQLTGLPPIRLNTQEHLDLSGNLISDLSSLALYPRASQLLSSLRVVNLAHNRISSALDLRPIAQAAPQLEAINVEGNPLAGTLNFLFELLVMFPRARLFEYGASLEAS